MGNIEEGQRKRRPGILRKEKKMEGKGEKRMEKKEISDSWNSLLYKTLVR